ncbi:MAG TPA: thioredoxin [Actinomycetota bacterium]|nr:thioredoxin [Actinomycetota bacterium]
MNEGSPHVVEVTDQTFGTAVLDESRTRPVVVDFWAAWCQPCRMIGPVLERLADEHNGQFLLAKLDVDANPQASAAFSIQSIPAVKAFRDGQPVSEFIGALPEQAIRQWLGGILPSEADALVERAAEAERERRIDDAERLYREALGRQPNHQGAALGLGGLLAMKGDVEGAREILSGLRPDPDAERLLAAIEVSEWASPNGDSPLARAEEAAAEGRFRDALEVFLAAVQNGTDEEKQRARDAMLKVFAVLGEDDPLTTEYRRKLATALF